MAREYRSKMGYLPKADIQDRIDANLLDAYDYVYATDTHELCIISPSLEIVPVKTQFDVYASLGEANAAINALSYTYAGEIVMIQTELDGLKPYVVNYSDTEHKFYAVAASDGHSSAIVDYDLAENRPIDNVTFINGDVNVADLTNGYYRITGSYRICASDPTLRITTDKILFCVWHDKENYDIVYVTEFGDRIKFYTCTNDVFVSDRYVLASELEDKIIEVLDENVDEYIDENVEENTCTEADINNLFS